MGLAKRLILAVSWPVACKTTRESELRLRVETSESTYNDGDPILVTFPDPKSSSGCPRASERYDRRMSEARKYISLMNL